MGAGDLNAASHSARLSTEKAICSTSATTHWGPWTLAFWASVVPAIKDGDIELTSTDPMPLNPLSR